MKILDSVWASFRTELYTYRWLEDRDRWPSTYFDEVSVLDGIDIEGSST